ncbi:hypothetical protein HYDPIDRAFT_138813 [Hydnomerulius pinastri MD-312]|uniref:Uncharacterized protein n=1 Tax=Hydnomerulius pinastri MD-312 TaxID=994086 RepID=A0A0C9W3A2_9AGAM|nr:hypothetical protein HYDPIDRAFT_138813 [Hydnomerulius pinastri MD-312]
MALRLITHGAIPVVVFPALSFAASQLIFGLTLYRGGLEAKLNAICDASSGIESLTLDYTGMPDVDKVVCGMVGFFHALMDPTYRPLLAELAATMAVLSIIPFVEAAREKRSFFLRTPAAVGVIFQLLTLGVIMPLYSLLFIVTGAAGRKPGPTSGAKINQANAEALLFALFVGYIIPTVCMIIFEDPIVTAIWQAFPLLMEVAQFVHRVIRPPSRYIESGYRTVQATFIFIFLASTAIHAFYVWPLLGDFETLREMFVPSVVAQNPATSSLSDGVAAFIKWDVIIGGGSTILSTAWMANGVLEFIAIILWHSVAIVLLGPGASIAGVLLWKEAKLNRGSQALKLEEKTE